MGKMSEKIQPLETKKRRRIVVELVADKRIVPVIIYELLQTDEPGIVHIDRSVLTWCDEER